MFFEGWYYNMVLINESKTIAVIPGILINDNERHAFLMVAYENISHYFRFPFDAFHSSAITDEFRVSIERTNNNRTRTNVFSEHVLYVDVQSIEGDDATEMIHMNLTMSVHTRPNDISWLMPGTMGPFSWLSFLQCNHHVLSMRHEIHGSLQIGQHRHTNITAIGYLEKDWGRMFPSTWIWGQANHWIDTNTSVLASLFFSFAIVPSGFGLELPGFLIIFEHNMEYYRFNSYLLSMVHHLTFDNRTNSMSFTVYDVLFESKLRVQIHFKDSTNGALLYAPRQGRMEKFVKEILDNDAYFDVCLSKMIHSNMTSESDDPFEQHGYQEQILFERRAHHVALEFNGNITWLTEQFHRWHGHRFPWNFSLLAFIVRYNRFILLLVVLLLTLIVVRKSIGLAVHH
jgi:tocopherol cyclase